MLLASVLHLCTAACHTALGHARGFDYPLGAHSRHLLTPAASLTTASRSLRSAGRWTATWRQPATCRPLSSPFLWRCPRCARHSPLIVPSLPLLGWHEQPLTLPWCCPATLQDRQLQSSAEWRRQMADVDRTVFQSLRENVKGGFDEDRFGSRIGFGNLKR